MADELDKIKQILGSDQSNIKQEYNVAAAGLNLDNTVSQVAKGQLTYALNASVENFDASAINYQNEPGNESCIVFPSGFILIGKHFIVEQTKHIFFIVNPETNESQIGYMDNNDCVYRVLVNAPCLAFNMQYPIRKAVHKITNCTTEIYWTDGLNPRRYLDINNIPYILQPNSTLCDPLESNQVDCNQLKLQPNFNIPELKITDVRNGGNLTAGTYQFAIQYCDASGNDYTSYYSVTNPTPIADISITTPNFNYEVGKSIVVNITNLDATGQFQYFNLAVIKTVNNIPSVELVGTYFIDQVDKDIIYTGQNDTQTRLTIFDIFQKYPYYEIAQDLTAVEDVLVWDNITSIDRINYQSIASQITLNWESYKLPANENYADELNATNLRGYLRDEVYAFEIVFLLKNGKQTDGFHIPGRQQGPNEAYPDVLTTNPDFIGEPTSVDPTTGIGSSPYWKIYNTASVLGPGDSPDIGNAKAYQYGEFAYWESEDVYPCNIDIWGDLANQPIRHHKFPDVLVSPIVETKLFTGPTSMVMGNDAVFPIGVRADVQQINNLIATSNLTDSQKAEIAGFKIIRGDRGTNKSIIAKGILRNVGEYIKEEQTFYYPNYPYNDLDEDPFINSSNNAYTLQCRSWLVYCYQGQPNGDPGSFQYTDCNTQLPIVAEMTNPDFNGQVTTYKVYEVCSMSRPTILSGRANTGWGDYDVISIPNCVPGVGAYFAIFNSGSVYMNAPESQSRWYVYADTGQALCSSPNGKEYYAVVDVGANVYAEEDPSQVAPYSERQPFVTQGPNEVIRPIQSYTTPFPGRRSSLGCAKAEPLKGFEKPGYRQVFNSPETSFGQPFLGNVLKLENVMFGGGKAHFVQVKNNANYKLLSKEAQEDALTSANSVGAITNAFNATAMFTIYQSYLTIYVNGITRKNYAYSYNSIADYNYNASIANDLGIKQRQIDLTQYLIPGVQNVGDLYNINNFQRESSVYIKTIEDRDGIPVSALPFPSKTNSLLNSLGNSIITDYSRLTIGGSNACSTPGKEQDISVVSYYASMKNDFVNQWGQIYSYDTVDTGFQRSTTTSDQIVTIFGGDTFISRFAFKTKLPFFFDNRVGAPDDSDIFYDEIGNVGYPTYWHSARSILQSFLSGSTLLTNIISYKATFFDCPNDPSRIPKPTNAIDVTGTLRTFYNGYFYLFAYGIPNFYCESSYNTDLRQAFNNKEGDFWPHVSTSIPDDWVQEDYVSIANDNTYTYNVTFSKQNKENTFTHLPPDWTTQLCYTRFPFRAIYSDTQNQNADVRVNNWLIYRPISLFDFPQNYGKLVSLDGIQNKSVLARFENKSLLYNTMLTINTSNPQAAYIGNPTLFASSPPIDFAETDLGYVGSQNKFLLKIPQGQITVDAKRGQVFLISGNQAEDLSAFGSGMNRFFTDHLAFEILRYFPDKEVIVNNERIVIPGVDVDNNFTGVGLHGVYDSKYDRIIITKLDYIPIDPDVKYDPVTREFYVEEIINGVSFKTQVYLTDPEYFCNKSWTLSYHLGLKSWISFHSYIPNWYIAENNFFYSGINGCCTDIEGEFQALVGNQNKIPPVKPTTSSTSTSTTTTTITTLSCELAGVIFETSCELSGDAVITVPPTTTTTVCTRPSNLDTFVFISGYRIDPNPAVDSTLSAEDACAALAFTRIQNPTTIVSSIPVSAYTEGLNPGEPTPRVIQVGQLIYDSYNNFIDCTIINDGWYFTPESWIAGESYNSIINVVNGYILEIVNCECGTVDTTTTLVTSIQECCGILFNTSTTLHYLNQNSNLTWPLNETMTTLNVPNFSSTYGIAMTANYLWSVTTEFLMWDITLSPFSATFNTAIPFPGAFTTSSGIVALNDSTIVAIDDSASPQDVVELTLDCNVNPPVFTATVQFSLQTDRTAIGNMLYTTGGKLLVINTDTISGDNYITQYNYATGVIELDLNIGAITPTSIYECNCSIFVVEADGTRYTIGGTSPYELVEVNTIDVSPMSATQIATCVPSSITDNANITTTTSTSSTTTTTTTTP
jgi:hypothetical protein